MELRGLGLIDVKDLFGDRLDAIVQTCRAGRPARAIRDVSREYERLGIDDDFYELLGLRVPLIRMPVAPGRSIAILVEVAARNQLLRIPRPPRRSRTGGAAQADAARQRGRRRRGGRDPRGGRRGGDGLVKAVKRLDRPKGKKGGRPSSSSPGCRGPASLRRSTRWKTSGTSASTTSRRRLFRRWRSSRCAAAAISTRSPSSSTFARRICCRRSRKKSLRVSGRCRGSTRC